MSDRTFLIIFIVVNVCAAIIGIGALIYRKHRSLSPKVYDHMEAYRYVFIKREYLLKFFTEEELAVNKFDYRPFVKFSNEKRNSKRYQILVPEQTVHNQYSTRFWWNLHIDNFKHYLNFSSILFVPYKYIDASRYAHDDDSLGKLEEMNQKLPHINEIIQKILTLCMQDAAFCIKHPYVMRTKQFCEHIIRMK